MRGLNQNITWEKKPQEQRPKNCSKGLGKSPGCKEAQREKPIPGLSGDRFLHMCELHSHPPNSAQGRWSHSDQLLLRAGHCPDKSLSLVPVLASSRISEKSVISLNTVPGDFSSWLSVVHGHDLPSVRARIFTTIKMTHPALKQQLQILTKGFQSSRHDTGS